MLLHIMLTQKIIIYKYINNTYTYTYIQTYKHTNMSTMEEILQNVKDGKCTINEAQILMAKLNEVKQVTYKVSAKGAISFYGIRRMPITLYSGELKTINDLGNSVEFKKFLSDNASELSIKKIKK